jgi:hypothetical protein
VLAGARVAARGEDAGLVLELAREHDELFAARMRVRRETRAGQVLDDAGGTAGLGALALQPAAAHAIGGRSLPGERRGVDHQTPSEVEVVRQG